MLPLHIPHSTVLHNKYKVVISIIVIITGRRGKEEREERKEINRGIKTSLCEENSDMFMERNRDIKSTEDWEN
jgi:hypothetical protein